MRESNFDNVYIDPSVARGIAKRAIRESKLKIDKQIQHALKYIPEHKSKKGLYKGRCKGIRKGFKGSIIFESTYKKPSKNKRKSKIVSKQFFVWGMDSDDKIALVLIEVPYKPISIELLPIMHISSHAVQRIFERLNTTDTSLLREELQPCAIATLYLIATQFDQYDKEKGLEITTNHGKAILNRLPSQTWAVVTWIADKPGVEYKMSKAEQLILKEIESMNNVSS